MNLILEKTDQVRFFINIREVLAGAGIAAQEYDWYVSDIEANFTPEGMSWADQWMCGEDFVALIQAQDIQFMWAVFSAVPRGFRSNVSTALYVEGNPDYWNAGDLAPQLEGALFEIACWDSSAVILIHLPKPAQRLFMARFPDTRPL